jgi:hypothetical protein
VGYARQRDVVVIDLHDADAVRQVIDHPRFGMALRVDAAGDRDRFESDDDLCR